MDAGHRFIPQFSRTVCFFGLFVASTALSLACSSEPSSSSGPASARCASCHQAEFDSVSHPPHPGVRPNTCGTCHSEESWHPFRLQHSYALEGAHAKVDCFKCLQRFGLYSLPTLVFEGTPKECVQCHDDAHKQANDKVKNHAAFPATCEKCHSVNAWKPTLPHNGQQPSSSTNTAAPTSSPILPIKRTATPARVQRKSTTPATPKPVVVNPTPTAAPTRKPDRTSGASQTK